MIMIGFGLGTRCFYAYNKGLIYEFASKVDRDYFLAHCETAKYISSYDAYAGSWLHDGEWVRIPPSQCLGENKYRKERIKEWKIEERTRKKL